MRKLIRIFDEIVLYTAMLAAIYVWLSFVILNLVPYVNKV